MLSARLVPWLLLLVAALPISRGVGTHSQAVPPEAPPTTSPMEAVLESPIAAAGGAEGVAAAAAPVFYLPALPNHPWLQPIEPLVPVPPPDSAVTQSAATPTPAVDLDLGPAAVLPDLRPASTSLVAQLFRKTKIRVRGWASGLTVRLF